VIGALRGTLAGRLGGHEVLVDVNGVGYRVTVTTPTAAGLGALGDEVTLHVHTHVREDAIILYGFLHEDERRCFEAVLGARGVGPAMAVALLSALTPAALSVAVLEGDVDTLCVVPGVGRKTAQRLLLDLKSRLDLPDLDAAAPGGAPAASSRAEVRAALAELGYGPDEIRQALDGLGEDDRVEEVLRQALRQLATR
jgi:holliday junction DNA helicase RuvA